MATLREIRYSIREAYALYSDDSNISNEYIDYQIHIARSLLLSQRFSSRNFIIPQIARQSFYLDLEIAEENPFVDGLGTVLRSVNAIQIPFEQFNFKSNIKLNGGGYSDTNFTIISNERFPFVGRSKWLQSQTYVTIGSDMKLYFTSSNPNVKLIERVKLSMVCENPEKAHPFTIGYNPNVEFEDTEYPIPGDLIVTITEMIIKKLTINLTAKEDNTNDSSSENS